MFWVEGNGPRPETVGLGDGLVKYEIMDRQPPSPWDPNPPPPNNDVVGVFLVEIVGQQRIRVERVMGRTADEVVGFGDNARTYVR